MGVKLLENRTEIIQIKGQDVAVTGLELPYEYYLKRKQKTLEKRELTRLLGKPKKDCFQILLAHTPKYGKTYLEWGGDLIFPATIMEVWSGCLFSEVWSVRTCGFSQDSPMGNLHRKTGILS